MEPIHFRVAKQKRASAVAEALIEVSISIARLHNVRCLIPLRALHDLEGHFLSRRQGLEPVALDGREVHEHILSALLLDEPVTLSGIEPLHSTRWHNARPSLSASSTAQPIATDAFDDVGQV
jgi:hypothetical protein